MCKNGHSNYTISAVSVALAGIVMHASPAAGLPEERCSLNDKAPEISIFTASKTGSFYSDEMIIRGRIKGGCLASAGIFEGDRQVTPIEIDDCSNEVRSKDFKVKIDASQEPEIRAITRSGKARRLKIDVLDYRS